MEDTSPRHHAAVADARVPATPSPAPVSAQPPAPLPPAPLPPAPLPAPVDAHGFDPADFEWRPVPRRPRKDGWTPDVQQQFMAALARTGVVERACEEVDMSVRSAYDLRNAPGAEGFAKAWKAVLTRAADRMLDVAFEHAITGEEIPIFDQDGVRTGSKYRYNTRMATFLLRAYHPERFGHLDERGRRAAAPAVEAPTPAQTPAQAPAPAALPAPDAAPLTLAHLTDAVAAAVARLAPVVPAAPHLLAPPATMATWMAQARYDAAKAGEPDPYRFRVRTVAAQPVRVLTRAERRRARRGRQHEREDARHGAPTGWAQRGEDDERP